MNLKKSEMELICICKVESLEFIAIKKKNPTNAVDLLHLNEKKNQKIKQQNSNHVFQFPS